MKQIDRIHETVSFLQKHISRQPDFLIILGSGLGGFASVLENPVTISYETIPHFPVKQVEGHSGELIVGSIFGKTIAIMKGRPHYYQGFSDEEMRLPIQVFSLLGVKNLIVTNACGGMNQEFSIGDIMLIEDHINMMGRNPLSGDNQSEIGPRFIDMSEPYEKSWIKKMYETASVENILVRKGVYVGYMGPNYETRSEILAYRMLGGDVVGMSTVPEVIVAKHAGMKVLGLSCITNMSTGIQKEPLSHEEVLEVSKTALSKITKLLLKFIESFDYS